MQVSDSFKRIGYDYKSFKELLDEFVTHTHTVKVQDDDLTILSYKETLHDGAYAFYRISNESLNDFNNGVQALPVVYYRPSSDEAKMLLQEMVRSSSGMLLMVGKELFFLSEFAITSFADRAGVRGGQLQFSSLVRNLYIAEGLFSVFKKNKAETKADDRSTIVYRLQAIRGHDNRYIKKAFAVMGQRFVHTSFSMLDDIIRQVAEDPRFGKSTVNKWLMTHYRTTVHIDFTEYADQLQEKYGLKDRLVPGILLTDSDTGEASFNIKLTYRVGNGIDAVLSEQSFNHTSALSVKNLDDWFAALDLSEFETIAGNLAKQADTPINENNHMTVFNNRMKELGLVGAIGKANTQELARIFDKQYMLGSRPTIYDATTLIMQAGFYLNLLSYAEEKLAKACSRAFLA